MIILTGARRHWIDERECGRFLLGRYISSGGESEYWPDHARQHCRKRIDDPEWLARVERVDNDWHCWRHGWHKRRDWAWPARWLSIWIWSLAWKNLIYSFSHDKQPFELGAVGWRFEYVHSSYLIPEFDIHIRLSKALQLARDNAILGTTLLPNLTLVRGNNTVNASSSFEVSSTICRLSWAMHSYIL